MCIKRKFRVYCLIELITDYGDSSESIKKYLYEGLSLATKGFRVEDNLVYVFDLLDDDPEERLVIIRLSDFKFIIDTWIAVKKLAPNSIVLEKDENEKYSIITEFNAPEIDIQT